MYLVLFSHGEVTVTNVDMMIVLKCLQKIGARGGLDSAGS
jgi:hypothetical protein